MMKKQNKTKQQPKQETSSDFGAVVSFVIEIFTWYDFRGQRLRSQSRKPPLNDPRRDILDCLNLLTLSWHKQNQT